MSTIRVARGRSRSTRSPWASMRAAASAAGSPRPISLASWVAASHVTSHTSSQSSARPPSTSLIASMTTARAPERSARSIAARIRGRTAGWTMASSARFSAGSDRMRARSAGRSSDPSGRSTPSPNRSTIARSTALPGDCASRTSRSASTIVAPHRRKSSVTVDLPEAMLPVRAMWSTGSLEGRGAQDDCLGSRVKGRGSRPHGRAVGAGTRAFRGAGASR